jgi:hypothetical protein
MKLEFSRQIFLKYSDIKFYENSFIGGRVVPYWRTDIQTRDAANSSFLQFCKNATYKQVVLEWKLYSIYISKKNWEKQANLYTRGQTPTVTELQRKVAASTARTFHKCVVQK